MALVALCQLLGCCWLAGSRANVFPPRRLERKGFPVNQKVNESMLAVKAAIRAIIASPVESDQPQCRPLFARTKTLKDAEIWGSESHTCAS